MADLSTLGIETLALDVTDLDAIQKVRDDLATKTGGTLDILVNNAGQGYFAAASDMDMSRVRDLFEINLFASMCMVQEFLPLLISSGKGCVVNNASVAGVVLPNPFTPAYNATKAALHAFGNTLRIELAPFNISVVNLITGSVQSNRVNLSYSYPDDSFYKSLEKAHQERWLEGHDKAMHADEYARTVVAELSKAKPRGSLWAGTGATIIWFLSTFFPDSFLERMMAKMYGFPQFTAQVRNSKDKHV